MIKCQIAMDENTPCHQGAIEIVIIEESTIITAGDDGYIRTWDVDQIDGAEMLEDGQLFYLTPAHEMFLGEGVKVKELMKGPNYWIAQDGGGSLLRIDFKGPQAEASGTGFAVSPIASYHAGRIAGVKCSPKGHFAVTAGADGTVRVFDYIEKKNLLTKNFSTPASCIAYAPEVSLTVVCAVTIRL